MSPSGYEMNTIPQPEEPCLQNASPREDDQDIKIKQPTLFDRIIFGWWTLELISLLIALCLFIGLWLLISYYDDKPIDGFKANPFFTTLSAAITLISTGMRITILMPVAAAMGQLKWIHAKTPHYVREHQRIENATRGILGSAVLLFSRNVRKPVALGCLLMIGSLFLGTFNQNTVFTSSYMDYNGNETEAHLPVSRRFNLSYSYSKGQSFEHVRAPTSMVASAMYGWSYYEKDVQPGEFRNTPFRVNCTATACSWGPAYTLSVQSNCSTVKWAEVDGTVLSLPQHAQFIMKSLKSVPQSRAAHVKADRPHLLYIIAAGYLIKDTPIDAVECIMSWDVHKFRNTTLNNLRSKVFTQIPEKIQLDIRSRGGEEDVVMVPESINCSDSGDDACPGSFTVTAKANNGLQNILLDMFAGNFTTKKDSSGNYYNKPNNEYTELFRRTWKNGIGSDKIDGDKITLLEAMEFYAHNVATFISNSLRSQPRGVEWVKGKVHSYTPRFCARRMYLLYSGCFLVLSALFILATIFCTRESQPWRSSIYPYFYLNGIQSVEINKNGAIHGVAEMDLVAANDLIDLKDHHDGQGRTLRQVK